MKKMLKNISWLTIVGTAIAAFTGGFFTGRFAGSHEIVLSSDGSCFIYDTREALRYEREYAGALLEGLHRFYSNDDNDAWFELFVPTPEYQRIDSINGGDWEDFYEYETPLLSYYD